MIFPDLPHQLRHYRLLHTLGAGGMGVVYLAEDLQLGRQVAIKCLHESAVHKGCRERFQREARLLAQLNHPHIVQIYDYFEEPDCVALVMEYVPPGKNLHTHMREHQVSIGVRLRWLSQIAEGLAKAHELNIIHRDIKPENILISHEGHAKITDFGIARDQEADTTATGQVVGSYSAMSPEQARGQVLDYRSDLFSFGILAYRMMCDVHPFGDTDNKLQLLQRIIYQAPAPSHTHRPDLPLPLHRLLHQLLARNPHDRPRSARKVSTFLKHLSDDETWQTSEWSVTQAPVQRVCRKPFHYWQAVYTRWLVLKHKPWLPAGALGGLLITLLCLSVWQGVSSTGVSARYIAVLPPAPLNNATDSHPENTSLIATSIYVNVQHSITRMDDSYLVPRTELSGLPHDYSMIRRAAHADEVMTSEVNCQALWCEVTLNRLGWRTEASMEQPHVIATRQFRVLTDNDQSLVASVQRNVSLLYAQKLRASDQVFQSQDHAGFIALYQQYLEAGADDSILVGLEKLSHLRIHEAATLYREVALDLYHDTGSFLYVERLEHYLNRSRWSVKPEPADVLNRYALAIAKGDFQAAETLITILRDLHIHDAQLIELNAYLALARGEYREAVKGYRQAILLRPSVHNRYILALSYWLGGEYDEARQQLEAILTLVPDYFKAHQLFGVLSLWEGDTVQAIASFQSVLRHSDDLITRNNLGLAYLLAGDYEPARDLLLAVVEQTENETTSLLNLADIENLVGNNQKAEQLYRLILMIAGQTQEQQSPEVLRNQAQAHAHLGHYEQAIKTLKQVQRLDSDNVQTTYAAAIVYALAGERLSAIIHVEAALSSNMGALWFEFPWFDSLCQETLFIGLLGREGKSGRCITERQTSALR